MGKEHEIKKKSYGFRLKVKSAFMTENGQENPMKIDYLKFENDGDLVFEGKDDQGEFIFDGYIIDDYVYLKKAYIKKNTIHFVGRIEGNTLNLNYSYIPDYGQLFIHCFNRNFNASIQFDATLYNVNLDGKSVNVFLRKKKKKCKSKGLGIIDGRCFEITLREKNGEHIFKMKNKELRQKFLVDVLGQEINKIRNIE